MHRLNTLIGVFLFASAIALGADVVPPQLKVINELTIPVKPDGAPVRDTTWLVNESNAAMPLSLSLGLVSMDSSHQAVPAEVSIINAPTQIAAGQHLPITIETKNFWPGAGASAPLRNQGVTIGTVHIVAVPFKISLEGWKDNAPYPLRLRRNGGGRFTVVNPDPVPYEVRYTLSSAAVNAISGVVVLQPESSTVIDIPAEPSWFPCSNWFGALFREPEGDATLALSAVVPAAKGKVQGVSPWPTRLFGVHVIRGYWSEFWRPWFSYLVLFVLLAAGGICSLILTNWVPNQTLKAQLQDRLDALVGAVRNLPTSIDSGVRVATRVERLRIGNQLKSRSVIGADYAAMAKICEADIVRLETVVALVHEIQNIYRDAFWISPGFIPTLMEAAGQAAAEAEKRLNGASVSDADIAAARESITLANTALASAKTLSDEFRRDLSKRVAEVRLALTNLKTSPFLQQALARLKELDGALLADYEDPDKLPADCGAIDVAVVKLKILTDIAPIVDAFTLEQIAEMEDVIERMLGDLAFNSLSQIYRAQMRARELRERKTIENLRTTIEDGNFRITVNPPQPKTGETALHRVELSDRQFGSAAVRNEIVCTWKFGDNWQEDGWQVAHYYAEERAYPVTVAFRTDTDTLQVKTGADKTTVNPLKIKQPVGYTQAQAVRLTLALLIAIVGLLSGAADQIAKLDLVPGMIAIFMIGFSADQIKNIIAK